MFQSGSNHGHRQPTGYQLSPKADVAKCQGFDCPERQNCTRFTRPAASTRQVYGEFWRERRESCEHFRALVIKPYLPEPAVNTVGVMV